CPGAFVSRAISARKKFRQPLGRPCPPVCQVRDRPSSTSGWGFIVSRMPAKRKPFGWACETVGSCAFATKSSAFQAPNQDSQGESEGTACDRCTPTPMNGGVLFPRIKLSCQD